MKIQYKLSLSMISLSLAVLVVITGVFDSLNRRTVIRQTLLNNEQIVEKIIHHVEMHLKSSAEIALSTCSLQSPPNKHQ